MLSEVEPSSEVLVRAGAVDHPNGRLVEYHNGEIRQIVNVEGKTVLTVYRTRPIVIAREARAALRNAPKSFGLWTDMTIAYGDPSCGRVLAESIAAAVGGVINDRI